MSDAVHMPKAYDHAIMGSFLEKKHFAYTQLTGMPQPTYWFMTVANFQTVMDALAGLPNFGGYRAYFGYADPKSAIPANLATFGGSLLLIFTATDAAGNDLYLKDDATPLFVVTPPVMHGAGAVTGGKVVQMQHDDALPLIMGYVNTILPLSRQVVTSILTKYGYAVPPKILETTSFRLTKDWKDTVYQDVNNPAYGIKGVTFFLGAYSDDCGEDMKLFNLTTVVLQYADSFDYDGTTYYYHFDIENVDNPGPPAQTNPGGFLVGGDNTINPCPPNTCSGTSFPPNN
ncbi:MAG TPA: hypothetical protein VL547_13250 [Dinghuibacter sp.]|uniref:hypothetical protein n=1 Tax=Dinghuibacter sp. TaxID=2024697 RepID=UPI002CB13E92|nr:hypothetical protein [Dinghuibacter sp.]HTJ12995.1 hypothetical protein [Dinghuibacter sp.]